MAVDDTTSIDPEVDTSVSADDSSNNDDVDLEDIEVDLSDMQDNDDVDDEQETDSDDEASDQTDGSEEEAEESTDDSSDDTELTDEQKQAAFNQEMYERRQAEKQARIDRVNKAQDDYIAEASENRDPLELAVRQLQVTEYNNTVERVSNTVTNQYEKAVNDFPVLTTTDPVIQAEIDDLIDSFQAKYMTIDDYGNPTEIRGDLYATLQAKADRLEKLTAIKATNQVKSKTREKSKTLATPNRAPKEPKVDPDLAAFDEAAYG